MTDLARQTLQAIRGIPKKDEQRSLLEDLLAQRAGEVRAQQIHDSQVNIVVQREYAAMMKRFEEMRKAQAAEEERVRKINETRLQNLKKARRKLKRLRSQNE